MLKNGANYNALNKNLQTPVAFTTGKQKNQFFLDTCISNCITFEGFCNSVRGRSKTDAGDDSSKKKSNK